MLILNHAGSSQNKNVTLEKTSEGIKISGDDLTNLVVTGENASKTEKIDVSTTNGSIVVTNDGGKLVVGGTGSIKLDKSSATIYVGAATTLKAAITGASQTVTWSTSDKSIATVKNGVVTGVKAGTATITAKANGKTAKCKVTVKNPEVILSATSVTLFTGESYTIKAEVHGPSSTIAWKSKDKSIATVSTKGVVKGKKAGKTTITATANGVTVNFTVTVKIKDKISATSLRMYIGDSATLSLTGTSIKSVSSSNKKVASINNKGVVKALKTGKATIILNGKNGKSYKCAVTVAYSRIFLNKEDIVLDPGQKDTLWIRGTLKKTTWSTSNKKIATVSSSGVVTAVKGGSCIITAKCDGKKYKCKVRVRGTINKTEISIKKGKTYTLKLTNAKIKKVVTSNSKIATINKSGVVTGKGVGVASIVLVDTNDLTYSCKVKVKK